MIHNIHNPKAGFTLVEVLVSITILLLVIVGPMRILTQSTNSNSYSVDQVTASFLAQEGLELVQSRLNYRMLGNFQAQLAGAASTTPWILFQADNAPCFLVGGCGLYATSTLFNTVAKTVNYSSLVDCTPVGSIACLLYENSSTTQRSRYTHAIQSLDTDNSTWKPNYATPFTRTISLRIASTSDLTKIAGMWATSTVTWRSPGLIANRKMELTTYFTNVYDTK